MMLPERYCNLKLITQAAAASVYTAANGATGSAVAIVRLSADEIRVERVRHDAETAQAVHHPQIPAVFDVIADGADITIVTEHVEGESLVEFVRRQLPLDVDIATSILQQLLGALG